MQPVKSGSYALLQYRFHTTVETRRSTTWTIVRPDQWRDSTTSDIRTLWELEADIQKLSLVTQEATALSAFLYQDSLCIDSPCLLSKPFSETSPRVRSPAMYLEYEFLSKLSSSSHTANSAVKILRKLVRRVPAVLVHKLASSLLNTLVKLPGASPKYSDLTRITIHTIVLLPLTDKPELGVGQGLKVIKTVPDASSWYRKVISLRLLRRLVPGSAERLVRNFANFLSDRLEKQNIMRKASAAIETHTNGGSEVNKPSAESTTPATTIVKISTIRLFAQLLMNNNFAPLQLSPVILHTLFTAGRHIDVRSTVVESMLTLLEKSSEMEDKVGNEVYATFKTFAMAAACPSERDVVSEDAWLIAESGGPLLEINSDKPLLNSFIRDASDLLPERHHADYCSNVVLPLLDESTKQHNRWIRIFLGRLELMSDEASVTDFGPFAANAIRIIESSWFRYLPSAYLIRHRSMAVSYIDCLKLEKISSKLDRPRKVLAEHKLRGALETLFRI